MIQPESIDRRPRSRSGCLKLAHRLLCIISICHQCKKPANTHTNCVNQACHILFIQCKLCSKKYDNCCSEDCADFIKLPNEDQKNLFKKGKVKFTAQKSKSIKPKLYKLKN